MHGAVVRCSKKARNGLWVSLFSTASYNKGKKKYYMYYSCPKKRNPNYWGEKMHAVIETVLAELSFTEKQVHRIRQVAQAELYNGLMDRQMLLTTKKQKLKEVNLKIEKLEEKLVNDEIEPFPC
jgi:site-specific DNA recombinase